jgi:hypothetical protein
MRKFWSSKTKVLRSPIFRFANFKGIGGIVGAFGVRLLFVARILVGAAVELPRLKEDVI